ncbi:MAG: phosphotransferase, partial [Patescibacteria group bacterium]
MDGALIERILGAYKLRHKEIHTSQKGYRNRSYPVTLADNSMVNLLLYKSEPGMLLRIKRANNISNYLFSQGFPARSSAHPNIIRLQSGTHVKYGALYHYLPGHTIPWEGYTQAHIKALGKSMSDMHALLSGIASTGLPEVSDEYVAIVDRMRVYFNDAFVRRALASKLSLWVGSDVFDRCAHLLAGSALLPGKQPLHMDFVRSNILFADKPLDDTPGVSISGVLDFEKTAYGSPMFDIARTLAFLLVDCKYKTPEKIRKYFLDSGYQKRGAADLPSRHMGLLEPLLNMFLLHDFYKFLRHNPYEFLPQNEHF